MEKKERKSLALFVALLAGLAVVFVGCPADVVDGTNTSSKSETPAIDGVDVPCPSIETPWNCKRGADCSWCDYFWYFGVWYDKDDPYKWTVILNPSGKKSVVDPITGGPTNYVRAEPLHCKHGGFLKNQRFDDELGKWILSGEIEVCCQ